MSALEKYLKPSMDAAWEESKHHRADNGQFTSGSGRGNAKSDGDTDTKKGSSNGYGDNKGRIQMSEEKAEKIVRAAFKAADKVLKGLASSGSAFKAETDTADEESCAKINEHLTKHGLKAKVAGGAMFKIAEDGYDDIKVVDDPALEVLIDLCLFLMFAKDLHYRAKGKPFYGLHLLADLILQVSSAADELNEVYYMGEKGEDPPTGAFVAAKAAELAGEPKDEDALLSALTTVCGDITAAVERMKSHGVKSGTAAVLDDISKKALQAKGLLARTAELHKKRNDNKAAIAKVIDKGITLG